MAGSHLARPLPHSARTIQVAMRLQASVDSVGVLVSKLHHPTCSAIQQGSVSAQAIQGSIRSFRVSLRHHKPHPHSHSAATHQRPMQHHCSVGSEVEGKARHLTRLNPATCKYHPRHHLKRVLVSMRHRPQVFLVRCLGRLRQRPAIHLQLQSQLNLRNLLSALVRLQSSLGLQMPHRPSVVLAHLQLRSQQPKKLQQPRNLCPTLVRQVQLLPSVSVNLL